MSMNIEYATTWKNIWSSSYPTIFFFCPSYLWINSWMFWRVINQILSIYLRFDASSTYVLKMHQTVSKSKMRQKIYFSMSQKVKRLSPGMLPKGTPRQDMSRMSTGACNIQIENSQLENWISRIENWISWQITNSISNLIGS